MTAADDGDRKRAELSIKLEALKVELESWRTETEPGAQLAKHHSQVRRVAGRLEPLAKAVQARVDDGDVGGNWPTIERETLDLHRVWDFFRERLALRFVPWLRDYLLAADEYAWAGYEPAQQAAVTASSVSHTAVREPPLVCFSSVSSPFSIARGGSYAREVGSVGSPQAVALVAALPIPVIGVPWYQLRHLPDALIVGHEVGHLVLHDFGVATTAEQLVDEALPADSPAAARPRWREWTEEAFADVYGALVGGPAYALSLGDFLLVGGIDPTADGQRYYPPSATRLSLTIAALRNAGCATADLETRFAGPLSALGDARRKEADAVAEALVSGRFEQLGGALTGVLDPRTLGGAEAEATAALRGWPLEAADIRTLFASATYAFSSQPDSYRSLDLTGKVLKRAKCIQEPGTRFRGGGVQRDEAALAAADAAAADDLYALLTAGT